MQALYKSGRYFYAITILSFGIIQICSGNLMIGFLNIKGSVTARMFLLYLTSTVFILSGITMMFDKTALGGARIAFFSFFVFFFYPHFIDLITDIHNGGQWTVIAETMALGGGALILAGLFGGNPAEKDRTLPFIKNKISAGRVIFALSLFVFAILHFLYAEYIGTLITSWIPFPVFWAYFVGVAFLAAGISLLVNIKTRLACSLLGFMFLFWVIFLHAPRVVADPHKESEWTSLFIALGFSGIFFTLAGLSSRKTNA